MKAEMKVKKKDYTYCKYLWYDSPILSHKWEQRIFIMFNDADITG